MSDGKLIRLNNIDKSYSVGQERVSVLKKISIKCYHGKWHTIYGASGSGKTTLLNILGGIDKPDTGNLLYGQTDIYSLDDKELSNWRNLKIGFVFQFFYLISEISVEENILLPLSLRNLKKDGEWLAKITGMLDITHLMKRNPLTLSGGEKQRVAMARAAINKPDFIIADEPTGNLDSDNSASVIRLMTDLMIESDAGIILATHEQDLMEKGDFRYHLKDGMINEEGEK